MKKIILIFLITIITNYSFADNNDDLSGNAIDCYTEDDKKFRYYITIKFTAQMGERFGRKALFAFAEFDSTKNEVKQFLNTTEVMYTTNRTHIGISTLYQERLYELGSWGGYAEFSIDRRDLSTNLFEIERGGFLINMDSCEIADYDNPNLFEIYNKLEEFLNYPEPSQEKKLL